jgi:transcriptional regulator with XRE-family HTH domain
MKPRISSAQLLVEGRRALGMSQRQFGPALGWSHRTATRWDAGYSPPSEDALRKLAGLLLPVDRALAEQAAAHIGETLESLGLVAPTPPAPPPAPPAPPPAPPAAPVASTADLVDVVVCAAAEATDASPRAIRSLLYVAFRRARQIGLTVEQVEGALAPPPSPPLDPKPTPRTRR